MHNYIITYHGGKKPESPEEGAQHMEKWKAWINQLGDKVINPGTPLKDTKIVTANSVEDEHDPNAMQGFAIIQAADITTATSIAKSDPFLESDGKISVSQMIEMP